MSDIPTAHAQWVEVETRPRQGGGLPVITSLLRHTPSRPGRRFRNQAGGSDIRPNGDEGLRGI